MRTLLDYVGLNPLRPLVAFGGDESGGNGGDSRPEEAKALDETGTTSSKPVPVVDYSGVDLSGLPLLPQEIPVKYEDTTSGIEEVVDFYSPPEFGYDLRDPNEPEVMMQDGKLFSGIADGERYESGQPVGSVGMDNIAGLGRLELSDLSAPDPLALTGSTTKIASPSGVGPGQTVDFNRLIDAGGTQDYDIYSPPLTDDDMGLPDISVDEAMLDPLGFATGGKDDPYSATLAGAGDVVGDVVTSTPVPDVDLSDIYGQYRKSPNESEARFIRDMMRFAKDDEGDYVVKPRLGDYLERAGLFVADLMLPEELLGLDISSATPDRVNAALEAYKTGSLAYGPDGKTLIGVNDSSGNLIRLRPDGPVDLFLDDDDDDCPPGYERNPVTGVCEPIEEEGGDPKITLPDVNRPDPSPVRPDLPIPGPIEPGPGPILPPPSRRGMKIRAPRFAEGGPVTPNIDRFLGSLRG